MREFKIAVLGAGIVGLTTTLELKKEFGNATIDLIADKFYNETTSFVAAGIFRPTVGYFGPDEETTRTWINKSYSHWYDLSCSSDADQIGTKEISGYYFSSKSPSLVRNKYLESLVHTYREATDDELTICPGNWKYGSYFTTLLIDPPRYLKWALNQVKHSGMSVIKSKVEAFSELNGKYDVIVNCTGFGGTTLCEDNKLYPIRGQVCRVKAPWIKNFFYADFNTYIIPSFDSVTLGGCRDFGNYDAEFSLSDYNAIRDRCESIVPSLENAEIIGHRMGIRPHRLPVRVEKEYYNVEGAQLKIVHNYGHGGYGVTTAPGTALNAVQLVKEMLLERSKL